MTFDESLRDRHLALAAARLPGPDYYTVLQWLHLHLLPRTYVEIGVRGGESLRLASPPTRCLGIDPEPRPACSFTSPTTLVRETSDVAFATGAVGQWLADAPIDLAFVDGSHIFEDALRDVTNLEAHATAESVMVLHDTIPLDDLTSSRNRSTAFYTGDVWKVAACLHANRPDLTLVTVPAYPSGLTLVFGFGRRARASFDDYADQVNRLRDATFALYDAHPDSMPRRVPNTREAVLAVLRDVSRQPACAVDAHP